MEGFFIDLRSEMVRLVMMGESIPESIVATKEYKFFFEKTEKWFRENPVAKEVGIFLLRHNSPLLAHGFFELHCLLKSEKERAEYLEVITKKEQELAKEKEKELATAQ